MTFDYTAPINYYDFLVGKPHAWEFIFSEGSPIKKGDFVNVIEVDMNGDPTGNEMLGEVLYRQVNDVFVYRDSSMLVYVIPV